LNRNRLIAGLAILATLGIMTVIGLVFLINKWRSVKPPLTQQTPVMELTNCNPNNVTPCITSFGLDSDGNMLVNLLVPKSDFPKFYLVIVRDAIETRYKCQNVEKFSTGYYCAGANMPPGEPLRFKIISKKDDTLLAEGDVFVIGLAFPTLKTVLSTALPSPSGGVITEMLPTKTPAPFQLTPNSTSSTSPSYPNPNSSPSPNASPSYP